MINRRKALFALASTGGLVVPDSVLACKLRPLLFSDTQQLDETVVTLMRSRWLTDDLQKLVASLQSPPHSKGEVCAELARLHQLVNVRSEHLRDIRAEVQTGNFRFGGLRLGSQTGREFFPVTLKFLSYLLFLAEPLIHSAKLRFDRVRPSLLDPSLTTILPLPRHPAFPSGHACQATAVSIVLSRLAPKKRRQFAADAHRITVNREIAGLHYPSDGLAGVELARKFIGQLETEDWFDRMISLAAPEWKE